MKTIIIALGILAFNLSYAGGYPTLKSEITENLNIDISKVELNKNHQDFVVVSFNILDGQIIILDIDGSKIELEELVINKLNQLNIQSDYDINETYYYRINFDKR